MHSTFVVELIVDDGRRSHEVTLHFAPQDERSFSFLAYSCNGPFGLDRPRLHPDGSVRSHHEPGVLASHINSFNLLADRVSGRLPMLRPDRDAMPTPSFAIAMGDQIYVDADAPLELGESLSLFHGARSEISSVDLSSSVQTQQLLSKIYRYHWAIPPLAEAMAQVPVAMVWDDHEIRDGWGSQGDESDPAWLQYFGDAQAVYRSYQTARNPVTQPDTLTEFHWGAQTHVLLLDQRTHKSETHMMRPSDYEQLRAWLRDNHGERDSLYVLVSPVPIATWTVGDVLANAVGSGIADDMRDRLAENPSDQQSLFDALVDHFSEHSGDRLLVLSGDVHRSAVTFLRMCDPSMDCELDYEQETPGIIDFGWEVISSGIANDRHDSGPASQILVDAVENTGIGGTYGREPHQLVARARGGVTNAPSFAEVIVDIVDERPEVSIVFFPSAWSPSLLSNVLANDHRALRGATPLETVDVWALRSNSGIEPVSDAAHPTLGYIQLPRHATKPRYSLDRNGDEIVDCIHYHSVACASGVPGASTTNRWAGWPDLAHGATNEEHTCGPPPPDCAVLMERARVEGAVEAAPVRE